ncbi:MAG: HAMP domain-containing sensor histidine kinase [Desulfobacteraceae bacterium]|jgi:signal transduction histidine kinase
MTEKPLYNSTIIDNYIHLLRSEYPHINIEDLLSEANIEPWELDPGNWFTQSRVNRFYKLISEKTGNPNLSRSAGRFSVANRADNIMRQSALSQLSPSNLYDLIGQISTRYSKAMRVFSRKLSSSSHEIITEWLDGVHPEQYQCEGMMGYLEAVHSVFRSSLPEIKHPECFFRNDRRCRYIISWKKTVSERIKRIRNLSTVIFVPLILMLILIDFTYISPFALSFVTLFLLSTITAMAYENKELHIIIGKQDFKPHNVLDSHNRYHRSTNLLKDISIALTKNTTVSDFISSIGHIHLALGYRSGLIVLIDYSKNAPSYSHVYRYIGSHGEYLSNLKDKEILFSYSDETLNKPFVKTKDKCFHLFPEEIQRLLSKFTLDSIVYIPMVYEKALLGFICLENYKKTINASDLYILHSIASQSALSITNISFNQSLLATEKLKQDYVSVASHELLTPVQIITFAVHSIKSQLTKMGLYKSDLAESMDILDQSVLKLGSISQSILDFSKLEADLRLEAIGVGEIVQTLERETKYITNSYDHQIKFSINDQIDSILCHKDFFIQLLYNLIENAAKYTPPKGFIKISFDISPAELLIFVEDNGIGINEKYHEQVFMKFFQVDKNKSGSGMGLSFCKEVVRRHEGYITVNSPLYPEQPIQKGTRFTIHLPINKTRLPVL